MYEKSARERIQEDPVGFLWTIAFIGCLIGIPLGLIVGMS